MKSAWVWIGSISGLAGGVCAGLLAGSAQSRERPALAAKPAEPNAAMEEASTGAREAQRVIAELSALRAELRALREQVLAPTSEARQAVPAKEAPPRAAYDPSGRHATPPVPIELQELALQVEALQAAVEGLTEALGELTERGWPPSAPPTIEQIRAGKPYTDWAEVKAVHAAYNTAATDEDKLVVAEALQYMTYEEVLGRFGRPSAISGASIGYGELLYLEFTSGYVVNVMVEEP